MSEIGEYVTQAVAESEIGVFVAWVLADDVTAGEEEESTLFCGEGGGRDAERDLVGTRRREKIRGGP